MAKVDILNRVMRMVEDAYQQGVNPLPLLRRIYPHYKFSGGKLDIDRELDPSSSRQFMVHADGKTEIYFFSVTTE